MSLYLILKWKLYTRAMFVYYQCCRAFGRLVSEVVYINRI